MLDVLLASKLSIPDADIARIKGLVQVSYWLSVCSDVALAAAPSAAPGQQAVPPGLDRDGSDDEPASDSDEDAGTAAAIPSPTTQPEPSPEAASAVAIMGQPF